MLLMATLTLTLSSCDEEPSTGTISVELLGTWKSAANQYGDYSTCTFNADGTMELIDYYSDSTWEGTKGTYSVKGICITYTETHGGDSDDGWVEEPEDADLMFADVDGDNLTLYSTSDTVDTAKEYETIEEADADYTLIEDGTYTKQ